MTDEEISALMAARDDLEKQLADSQTLIESLTEENQELIKKRAELTAELHETKKLNFTLARQVSRQPEKSVSELLNDLFKEK